eukprot:4182289-Pyramimonas_sp.AAC.1
MAWEMPHHALGLGRRRHGPHRGKGAGRQLVQTLGTQPRPTRQIRRARPKIYFRMFRVPANRRWTQRRGAIASIILALWELGWDSRGPEHWVDRDKNDCKFPQDGELGDHIDILDAITADVRFKVWQAAAGHYNRKGLEHGADTTDLKRHLDWLRTQGKY